MAYRNKTIDNIEDKIAKNRKEYAAEEQAVNEDENLSAAGKRNKVEQLKSEFHGRHKELLDQKNEITAEEHSKLQSKLFDSNNKTTADQLAFDQAVMQFADIQASQDDDLTERVAQISSVQSAKALGKVAYESGNRNALTAVYEKFDSLQEPIDNLSDFEDRYVHEKMGKADKLGHQARTAGPPRPKAGV